MRIEYHPGVPNDVAEALRRYDSVSNRLGREFESELRAVIRAAAENPGRFHLVKPSIHRANLKRFPYHLIYREIPGGIRVLLFRHHRRDPRQGMDRE